MSGTPHQGGNNVTMGKVASAIVSAIGGQVNNDLLRYLAKNSLLTQIANEDFSYQWEDYRVVTFFETRATKLKKAGIFGRAFKAVVVDAQSAKVGLAGHREMQISVDSDHTNLCKFGAADNRYEPVAGQLKSLVQFCIDQNKPTQDSLPAASTDYCIITKCRDNFLTLLYRIQYTFYGSICI